MALIFYQATPIPLRRCGGALGRHQAIEAWMPQSRAEEWIPSWRRFAQMTNQKRRSVLRRGAAGGLIRGRSRLAPLSSRVERVVPRLCQAQLGMAKP